MLTMRLIVIAGPAGSGKTTLANELARLHKVKHIDFDVVTAEIVSIRRAENPGVSEPDLLERVKQERYSVMAQVVARAREQLAPGCDCLLVSAPFSGISQSQEAWNQWLEACGDYETVNFIWLTVDSHIRLDRIRERGSERDEKILSEPSSLGSTPQPVISHQLVDSSRPLTRQCEALSALFS